MMLYRFLLNIESVQQEYYLCIKANLKNMMLFKDTHYSQSHVEE